MSELSPYQTPQTEATPPPMPPTATTPGAVGAFGVLHLVFAGIGVCTALWGFFVLFAGNPLMKGGNPSSNPGVQMQMELQSAMKPMSLTTHVLALVVAVPMIVAGIRLLKKRRSALKWSNAYAWLSLGAKVVNLAFTILVMVPAMQHSMRTVMQDTHLPARGMSWMFGFMTGGAILGVVATAAYPILSLALLNRPAVKAWFATRPD